MNHDPRCCGSGTCIIDPEGRCWCGQQWDGQKMVPAKPLASGQPESEKKPPVDPDVAAHP